MRYLSLFILTFLIFHYALSKKELIQNVNTKAPLHTVQNSNNRLITKTKKKKNNQLKIDVLPEISFGKMILVSSGQSSQCRTIVLNDCVFDLVMDNMDTNYLATIDKKFQTPEGYKVGTKFQELPIDIQKSLHKESGWGYYYKLPSDWNLGFCEGLSCTETYPQDSSSIKWIFKRKR